MKTCLQPHPLSIRNGPQSASCFTTKAGLKWKGVTCRRVSGGGKKQGQRLEFRISFNLIPHRLTPVCLCVTTWVCSHICDLFVKDIQAEIHFENVFYAAVYSVHLSSSEPFLSLFSQEKEEITSTQKLHIGPFKFSSVAFCLYIHRCMQKIPVSEWRGDISQSKVCGSWRQLKIKPLLYFFKLEQNWNTWIRVAPTSVTRGIHLQQHFREVCLMHHFESEKNVSGTHEGEILPNWQPVIFRDRFTTKLKYLCTTMIKTKQKKKRKGSSHFYPQFLVIVFRSCSHGFLIPGEKWLI